MSLRSRREFLTDLRDAAIGAAWLSSPARNAFAQPTSEPTLVEPSPVLPATEKLRRNVGAWTDQDVKNAGEAMIHDPRFSQISLAGEILLDNLHPLSTRISSRYVLFSDDLILVNTVAEGTKPFEGARGLAANEEPPMSAIIDHNDPIIIFTLRGKRGTPDTLARGTASLRLDRIVINKKLMEGKSDTLFKIFLAKEVHNIAAMELATLLLMEDVYKDYEMPGSEVAKRVLRTASIHKETPEGIPVSAIGDLWAHFIMLPDYLQAKDLGMITEEDKKLTWVFDTSADLFIQEGVLLKDENGRYKWIGDRLKVLDAWYRVAAAGYKILFEGSVPEEPPTDSYRPQ